MARTWTEYESWIIGLINGLPADMLTDLDECDRDQLKGEIVTHLIENGGNISDSDIRGLARAIVFIKTGNL